MELFLQFGYGMMEHCRHLVRSWAGGTVILSPRDQSREQLERLSDEIRAMPGGHVLLDPQFYIPRSDHHRLTAHEYWPDAYQTNAFFGSPAMQAMLNDVLRLNRRLGCDAFILPGLMATAIDDDWLATLRSTVEQVVAMNSDMPLCATIALAADCVRNTAGIHDLLAEFETLEVDGAYLLFEHPNGDYIVQDPIWLANALELSAGLRLLNKTVIVGYANHGLLCLGAASVDAIASGTWMNVRAFTPDRFYAAQEDEIRRKAVWYYAPLSLSEYKPAFLDMAQQRGVLASMSPPGAFGSTYAAPLFSGMQPSSVEFGEPEAFRHYLQCMLHQSRASRGSTFDVTLANHRQALDTAERLMASLSKSGVLAQGRAFGDAFDAVRSALISLEATRGPTLRRAWANL
jgi:quinol monooxygenase YgiN